MRRTQIYLAEGQDTLLEARARATGTTKSALVRDAIDAFLSDGATASSSSLARMRTAVTGAAGVAQHLPCGSTYVEEIRAPDAARIGRLDDRRSA